MTGKQDSDSPPSASAADILRPLSRDGSFPSSGAVAARARKQIQNTSSSPVSSPASSPGTARSESQTSASGGPVQKRSKTVETMYVRDEEGARSFRRLIVEYN